MRHAHGRLPGGRDSGAGLLEGQTRVLHDLAEGGTAEFWELLHDLTAAEADELQLSASLRTATGLGSPASRSVSGVSTTTSSSARTRRVLLDGRLTQDLARLARVYIQTCRARLRRAPREPLAIVDRTVSRDPPPRSPRSSASRSRVNGTRSEARSARGCASAAARRSSRAAPSRRSSRRRAGPVVGRQGHRLARARRRRGRAARAGAQAHVGRRPRGNGKRRRGVQTSPDNVGARARRRRRASHSRLHRLRPGPVPVAGAGPPPAVGTRMHVAALRLLRPPHDVRRSLPAARPPRGRRHHAPALGPPRRAALRRARRGGPAGTRATPGGGDRRRRP